MTFGGELRRLRLERGLSLTDLAGLVYYSKGHLSKIENDKHLPAVEYAWQLDAVLGADGALVKTLPGQAEAVAGEHPPIPSGLTYDSRHFIGRPAELESLKVRLCEMPADPDAALICVIDGMPGVGKTALASRAAQALGPRFPDGVFFLDLHGYTGTVPPLSSADALDRLLRRFGLPVPAEPDERSARFLAHLATRKFLIVLDNARNAGQIRPLIPAAGSSRLLITSRNRLATLDMAVHLSLGPLAGADAERLLRAIAGSVIGDTEEVAEVVRACGGLPLALTVAAARLRTGTTLDDLRSSLAPGDDRAAEGAARDPLDELADGERSVIAALEPSYRALPEDARGVFARLGLLPCGDWTIPYVGALERSGPSAAIRATESLLRARLVDRGTDGRFRFHDLVAAYARRVASAELSEVEAAAVRLNAVTWAVDMAFRADALLEPNRYHPPYKATSQPAPFTREREAIEWMRAEGRNLAALCLSAHAWGLDEPCWQLAFALRGHFFLTKQWDDWEATHVVALAAARRSGDLVAETMTRNNLGLALLEMGRPDAANEHFQAVLDVGSQPGLEYARANALANQGWVRFDQGSWADSLRCNEEALRFYIDRGMHRNAAIAKRSIALSEIELARFEEAIGHLGEALDTFVGLGLTLNEAMARNCLGEAYLRMGNLDRAEHCLLAAAERARQSPSQYEEARAMRSLGEIAIMRGDRKAAIACWRTALDLYEEIGAPEAVRISDRLALI
jgi:tetratricopeptide (TPR) repeat protein/transcriptional regulator with XRE-family HTH domain